MAGAALLSAAAGLAGCSDGSSRKPADDPAAAAPAGPTAEWHVADEAVLQDPAIQTVQRFITEHTAQTNDIGKIHKGDHPQWKTMLPEPPKLTFTEGKTYYWDVTTNQGNLRVRLMSDVAPMHVSSLIYLTMVGFYDGIKFHRVRKQFMAQGGCPHGNGMGDPGYQLYGEFKPGVGHDKPGLLSAANTGRPKSDGSQFFLTFVPTPYLDGKHTVYGDVVGAEGLATLRNLEKYGVNMDPGTPLIPLFIERAAIAIE